MTRSRFFVTVRPTAAATLHHWIGTTGLRSRVEAVAIARSLSEYFAEVTVRQGDLDGPTVWRGGLAPNPSTAMEVTA